VYEAPERLDGVVPVVNDVLVRDAIQPRLHVFVCANRREGSPLGPGCGDRGDAVYEALKEGVARSGAVPDVWITKTQCLGICPKQGATIARYPPRSGHGPIETEVEPSDVPALLEDAGGAQAPAESVVAELGREIDALHDLQRQKVLDLARRLKPGLTLEDVQNPHDFPELDDPDWHYADGVLAGIASVKSVLAALLGRSRGR
jgi:(2Fe-2S) ferredoxin